MPQNNINPFFSDLSNSSFGNQSPASSSSKSTSPGHPAQSISPIDSQRLANLSLGMDNNNYMQNVDFLNPSYNDNYYTGMTVTNATNEPFQATQITTFNYSTNDPYNHSLVGNFGNTYQQLGSSYSDNYLTNSPCNLQNFNNSLDSYPATLKILEPPVEKFRFRYKSEMHGTHGSLNGANSKRTPKTFPEVQLTNFDGNAIIRCSLFQVNLNSPHSHQLVVRRDELDINDPHDVDVGPKIGYIAQFHNMGIIHTAKKDIKKELLKKKEDRLCFQLGIHELNNKQKMDLENETEKETKLMNLNQVRLCFEAFKKELSGTYTQIAAPVFSNPINNRKSAQTGELRIVRMSIATGKMTGGDEMILLVEKVSKKNIKIRFYELNSDGDEVWEAYAKFNEPDVHHQYAIICQTPPYRNIDAEEAVKVYIELVRPSDDERSEKMKEPFTYKPVSNKRKRRRIYSSATSSSDSMKSDNIPTIVKNPSNPSIPSFYGIETCKVNTEELLNRYSGSFPIEQLEKDGVSTDSLSYSKTVVIKTPVEISTCFDNISKLYNETINASPSKVEEIKTEIVNIYKDYIANNSDGDTLVHDIINNFYIKQGIMFYRILEKLNLQYLLNENLNSKLESPLHCACANNAADFIRPSLTGGCNPNIKDKDGNTALHVAVREGNLQCVEYLLKKPESNPNLNSNFVSNLTNKNETVLQNECDLTIKNDEGLTPLHLAIKHEHAEIFNLLLKTNGAISKERCCKDGNNALHMAVIVKNPKFVKTILENSPSLDIVNDVNNAGLTPIRLAKMHNSPSDDIEKIIEMFSFFQTESEDNIVIKQEEDSSTSSDDEETNMDREFIKTNEQNESSNLKLAAFENFKKCLANEKTFAKLINILNDSDKWKQIVEQSKYSYLVYLHHDVKDLLRQVQEENLLEDFSEIFKDAVLKVVM